MESTPLYVGYPLLQDVDVTYADGSTATVTKGGMISPYLPMSPHISPSLPTGHQGRNDRAVCIRRRRGGIVPLGCRARRERSRRRPSASGVALEPEAGGWRVPPLPHGTRTHHPLRSISVNLRFTGRPRRTHSAPSSALCRRTAPLRRQTVPTCCAAAPRRCWGTPSLLRSWPRQRRTSSEPRSFP